MNLIIVAFFTMIGCDSAPVQPNSPKDSSVVFAGITPCGNVIRPIHKINPEPDCPLEACKCIMVEWELTLYMDANTTAPTRYTLKGINRHTVRETNMYSEPGIKSEAGGR